MSAVERNAITAQMQYHLNAIQDLLRQLNQLNQSDNDSAAAVEPADDDDNSNDTSSPFVKWMSNTSKQSGHNNKNYNNSSKKKSKPYIPPPVVPKVTLHVVQLSKIADSLQNSIKNVLQEAIAGRHEVVWSGGDVADGQFDVQIFVFVPGMGRFSADECLASLQKVEALIGDAAGDKPQFVFALSTSSVDSFPATVHGIPVISCRADPSTLALQADPKHFVTFSSIMYSVIKNKQQTSRN